MSLSTVVLQNHYLTVCLADAMLCISTTSLINQLHVDRALYVNHHVLFWVSLNAASWPLASTPHQEVRQIWKGRPYIHVWPIRAQCRACRAELLTFERGTGVMSEGTFHGPSAAKLFCQGTRVPLVRLLHTYLSLIKLSRRPHIIYWIVLGIFSQYYLSASLWEKVQEDAKVHASLMELLLSYPQVSCQDQRALLADTCNNRHWTTLCRWVIGKLVKRKPMSTLLTTITDSSRHGALFRPRYSNLITLW
jgi:hypothetical protein